MKKDIFSTWIREFCSLVFIQTIQAFIFAIVMALIISVMTPDNVSGVERADVVSATGFIAVIALASISKIEDLVKKIFGVQSNVTDPSMKGGMKSLASTMIAAKLARGVLDNGKKVAGGVGGVISANRQMRVAKTRYARDMNRKLTEFGVKNNSNGIGENTSQNNTGANATSQDYYNKALEAKKNGDMPGYYTNRGIAAGMNKATSQVINNANDTGVNAGRAKNISSISAAGNVGNMNFNDISNKQRAELEKMNDAFNDKMNELKAKKSQSVAQGFSGLIESSGALVGGTAGVIAGASLGDVGDTLKYGLAGMGIGDTIGSMPVKVATTTKSAIDTIAAEHKTKKEFADTMASMSSDAKKYINAKRTTIARNERAKVEFERMQKQIIDAGNLE